MGKILILANDDTGLYKFRKELIEELLKDNKVYISLPDGEFIQELIDLGCEFINTKLNRRSSNPIEDFKLLIKYGKVLKEIDPDIVLTRTIKPNIYGGIMCRIFNRKVIHTVTGLGSVYIQDMWQKNIIILLNRIAFKNASKVIFLNKDNEKFYKEIKIIDQDQNTLIVPGSGVNLNTFKYIEDKEIHNINFVFIARILKDKGIEEYLTAAENLKQRYNNINFQIVGSVDEDKYIELMKDYEDKGIVEYLGKRDDIAHIMTNSSCVVLPSYGEGRGTVLQEGAAIGRPLITCDTYGCKENVDNDYNGLLCKVADAESLMQSMEKLIKMSHEERLLMGKNSRKKAEKEFDRNIVIDKYMESINNILNKG